MADTHNAWPALLQDAEFLARLVAPELDGLPLYIVRQSRVRDTLGSGHDLLGWTSERLDLLLRDHLGPHWRGRGPALVLSDAVLVAGYADRIEKVARAVALHELAHVVEWLPLPDVALEREALQAEAELVARAASRSASYYDPELLAEYDHRIHHPATFGRAVLHLRHRAIALAGFDPPWVELWHAPMVHGSGWARMLGGELDAMMGRPIAEVLGEPLPEEYAAACAMCDHRFEQQQRKRRMNNIPRLLERVAQRLTARKAARVANFEDAVRAVADGKPIDADHLAAVLEDAGKAPEDLAAGVARIRRRQELKAEVKRGEEAAAERGRLQVKLEALRKEFEQARLRFVNTAEPLEERIRDLEQVLLGVSSARDQLRLECDDAKLCAEADALLPLMRDANEQLHRAREARINAEGMAAALDRKATTTFDYCSDGDRARFRKESSEYAERAARWEEEESAAHATLSALQRQHAELTKRMAAA